MKQLRSRVTREYIVILAVCVLYAAFAAVSIARPASRPVDTRAFVRRSELGLGRPALNEAANAAVRGDLRRAGYQLLSAVILRERVAGDAGTVTLEVRYAAGKLERAAEVTLVFHRSLWSLSTTTVGALPGAAS